ncbi:hypothetical protein [Rhizobium lusitanum]|nr:hypothetical protein [Rhizobium lusitanum]
MATMMATLMRGAVELAALALALAGRAVAPVLAVRVVAARV